MEITSLSPTWPQALQAPIARQAGTAVLAVAGAAAIFAAAFLLPPVLALPLAFTVTAFVLWVGSSVLSSLGQGTPTRLEAVRRFSSTANTKSIYDLETGFCAEWYFFVRVDEEVTRTKRSGESFGLLLVEPRRKLGKRVKTRLLLGLERAFRTADLVGRLGDLSFGVLLIDSDEEGTNAARDRLVQLVGRSNIRVGLTVHPDGDTDWRTLVANMGQDSPYPQADPIWAQDGRSSFDREARSL